MSERYVVPDASPASLSTIEALRAEVNYYRDSAALLRARMYRSGVGDSGRLAEFQRQLENAHARLAAARATRTAETLR